MSTKYIQFRFALDKKNAHFRTKRQCNSDLVKKEATNVNFSQNYPIKLCSDKNNAVVRTKKEITSVLAQSHEKRKQQTNFWKNYTIKLASETLIFI